MSACGKVARANYTKFFDISRPFVWKASFPLSVFSKFQSTFSVRRLAHFSSSLLYTYLPAAILGSTASRSSNGREFPEFNLVER